MAIEILSIDRRVDVSPTGDLVEVYQIRFRSNRGAYGVVRVPARDFDPARARELVASEAAKLDALYEPY